MSGIARAIGAAVLGLAALFLFVAGGPPALEAYRAQRPTANGCTEDLASLPRGTWVSLEDCAVDKFRSSSFRGDTPSARLALSPLRGQEYDLEEPSRFALAFADSSLVSFGPHDDELLYRLRDQVGVVLGSMNGMGGTHVEADEVESGLAPGAILIEARTAPPSQTPLTLLAGGGVMLVLAVWVAMRGRDEDAPVEGVRWGLVAVLLIVSLAASLRTLQWFFDPMRQTDEAAAREARRPPPAPRSRPTAAASLPEPTADDLKGLESPDGLERLRAADALMAKAVTPDLIAAVDRALDGDGASDFKSRLICLKARFPGPDAIDFLLVHFPSDRQSLNWTLKADLKCTFDALVARIGEDPVRVRDALVPGAFSDNAAVRSSVQAAFRKVDIAVPPLDLLKALNADDSFEYRYGLQALLALGAVRHNRPAVERAAFAPDPAVRGLVRHELLTNTHANAARIVAKGWLDQDAGSGHERLARDREAAQHDVSAALLEALDDTTTSEQRRARAVRLMSELGEVGVLPELEARRPALQPGPLLDEVNAAIAGFDPRRGRRSLLRPLAP